MKIRDIINEETRVAVYSATVETVAVKETVANMKAATIAADIADAVVDAFKADNYRQFVETMTNYGPRVKTINEINAWWTFVKNVKHGVFVATATVEAVLFNAAINEITMKPRKPMTIKQVIKMFKPAPVQKWATAGDPNENGFCFDLQRFAADDGQKAFFERLATENPLDTLLASVYKENPKSACRILNKMLYDINRVNVGCDNVYGVSLVDINDNIEIALETAEAVLEAKKLEDCKQVLASFPDAPDNLSGEELSIYERAAKVVDDATILDKITDIRNSRKLRRHNFKCYSRFIMLQATLTSFGDDFDKTAELLNREYHLLRGHRGFDIVPQHDEVMNKIHDLYKEALDKTWCNLLTALDSGEQAADNTPRRNTRVIRTQHDVEELMKKLMKRSGKGMSVTMLNIMKDTRVVPSLHTQDYGFGVRQMEKLGQLETCKMVTGAGVIQQVKRFCRAILMVSVQDIVNLCQLFNMKDGKFRAIYRTLDPKGFDRFWSCMEVTCTDGQKRTILFDLCTTAGCAQNERNDIEFQEEFFEVEEWKKIFAVNGYYVYDGSWATSSPGELKNKVVALPGVYKGGDIKRKVDWADFWHKASSGAWTEFIERGEKLSFEAVAEFTARITLVNAYAWYFDEYPMHTLAVYAGKIKAKRASGEIKEGHEFMDGMYVLSNEYVAEVLEKAKGDVEISRDAVVGVGLQNRTLNIKGYGLVVTQKAVNSIMDDIGAEKVHFYVYDMEDDQLRAWWNLSLKKFKSQGEDTSCIVNGEKIDLAGKIIVFHWTEESYLAKEDPQCLCDANAMKVGFEPADTQAFIKALASSHKSSNEQVTSGQLLSSLLAADYKRTFLQQDVLTDIMLQETKKRMLNEEGERLSCHDFEATELVETDYDTGEETTELQHPNYAELVDRVAPVLSLEYSFSAWRKRVDREMKRANKRIERNNIPIEGTHVTIVPDLGMVFGGVKVLGVKEDGVAEVFSNNPMATTLTLEKYIKKYKELAAAAGVSEALQQCFEETATGLSKGIAAVPCDDITARAGEGFDFDGDSMYFLPMNRGYKMENGHYRWALDGEEPDDFVTFGIAIRYPKTHPDGFMKIRPECWLGQPKCVYIE